MDNTITITKIIQVVAPPMATLVAAFLGAWFAYKLGDNSKKREARKININAANKALFNTFQMLNHMKLFQKDIIDPFRGNPGISLMMRPTLPETQENITFDFNSLTFILVTNHKKIIFDLYIEQQRYRETLKAIDYRSSLHLEKIQPVLAQAGVQEGKGYPPETIIKVLGPLLYGDLKQSTENIVTNVDKNVISLVEVKNRMLVVFKDLFPEIKFVDFEPM